MKQEKPIILDEYVIQTIQIAETKTGNDRFILIYGLFQELVEKADCNAEIRTKKMIIKSVENIL